MRFELHPPRYGPSVSRPAPSSLETSPQRARQPRGLSGSPLARPRRRDDATGQPPPSPSSPTVLVTRARRPQTGQHKLSLPTCPDPRPRSPSAGRRRAPPCPRCAGRAGVDHGDVEPDAGVVAEQQLEALGEGSPVDLGAGRLALHADLVHLRRGARRSAGSEDDLLDGAAASRRSTERR